jgi:hypothetical protein
LQQECLAVLQQPQFDPIRNKVELWRALNETNGVPFAIEANTSYPTDSEKAAIAQWATARQQCSAKFRAARKVPIDASPSYQKFYMDAWEVDDDISSKTGSLIVALYQGKLPYGDFATQRYNLTRTDWETRQAILKRIQAQDEQTAKEAADRAMQGYQIRMQAFSTYMAAVASRPVVVQQQQQQVIINH